jgi:hypothetical protein
MKKYKKKPKPHFKRGVKKEDKVVYDKKVAVDCVVTVLDGKDVVEFLHRHGYTSKAEQGEGKKGLEGCGPKSYVNKLFKGGCVRKGIWYPQTIPFTKKDMPNRTGKKETKHEQRMIRLGVEAGQPNSVLSTLTGRDINDVARIVRAIKHETRKPLLNFGGNKDENKT